MVRYNIKKGGFSFAVCAYKENPYLASTVESLLAQDARCPIIISTSTPNDHISAVARRFEVPVVVNPDPRGAASDWNYGYDAAETPLVTIAHQDDYYEPNYLSTMLAAVNDYEEGGPFPTISRSATASAWPAMRFCASSAR